MEIITQDDIRRSGADNIPDIFRFVSGVDGRRYSFGTADVAIPGYNQSANPHLLVLVNSRQIYFDDFGNVACNTISVVLDEIRHIEVVKGPNSALSGFNAVSGVINTITYELASDNVNSLTGTTGTQNLLEGSAVTTVHASDAAGARVSVGGYRASGCAHPETYNPVNPERRSVNAEGRMQW